MKEPKFKLHDRVKINKRYVEKLQKIIETAEEGEIISIKQRWLGKNPRKPIDAWGYRVFVKNIGFGISNYEYNKVYVYEENLIKLPNKSTSYF